MVEFFFIISGFFLYNTYNKKNIGIIEYTKSKVNKFWLKAVLITILLFITDVNKVDLNTFSNISQISTNILFLLEGVIPFNNNIYNPNQPIWYLCVLIYGGGIIYAIIKTFPKYHKLFLILLSFCGYCVIFNHSTCFNDNWDYPYPLLRGCAGISLGCMLNFLITKDLINIRLLNVISIFSFFLSFILLCMQYIHGIIPVICYFFLILAISNKDTIIYKFLNKPIFTKLSATSFEIFIGHLFVVKIAFIIIQITINKNPLLGLNIKERIIGSIIYLILIFIFGYFYKKGCDKIQDTFNIAKRQTNNNDHR